LKVCGQERLTGAMLDRLTHRVRIVEANEVGAQKPVERKVHRRDGIRVLAPSVEDAQRELERSDVSGDWQVRRFE
jgi:hypothetical protein